MTDGSREMWGLTTYFNPVGFQNKYENYKVFRRHTREQGLPLLAVEISYGDRTTLRAKDADILVHTQGSENTVLWQRDRLLNLALPHLPETCTDLCWIDADVIFSDPEWHAKATEKLRTRDVVQPFSRVFLLDKGDTKRVIANGNLGQFDKERCNSRNGFVASQKSGLKGRGATGFVWCARRELMETIGFYDKHFVGGCDNVMACAFLGIDLPYSVGGALEREVARWSASVPELEVDWLDGELVHLWHGARKNRAYSGRRELMQSFDPATDLAINAQGIYEWQANPQLQDQVRQYFMSRREDGRFHHLRRRIGTMMGFRT